MDPHPEPIPALRLKWYRLFFLIERLLATALFSVALTQTSPATVGGVWWLLVFGAVGFAGLSAWSAYDLVAKPGRL